MKTKKETFFNTLRAFLSSIFLQGLLTILPITLTIAIINVSYKVIKGWLRPIYDLEPQFLKNIPFSEFLLVISAIFLIGLFLSIFVLHPMVHAIEALINKIPLIRPVYNGIKQLISAFNPHDNLSFKQVVLIEFPHKGMYSLGFLTSECLSELSPDPKRKFYNIFVPTTPNPTTGFFIMAGEEDVRVIDISRQEAMALIISGGIIQPDRFSK